MDLGIVAQAASRVGAAAELRAGGERIAVSARLLLPLLQSRAEGVPTELARDLRAALAGRDTAMLVLSATASQAAASARLEIGARQFPLPVGLRDAIAAAIATAATDGAAPTPPATPAASVPAAPADLVRTWAVAAQTTAAAAIAVSGSGATRMIQRARDDRPAPVVQFSAPLLEPVNEVLAVQPAAERLRQGIERSGLFFESHVAQWAQGARDAADMRAEALRLLTAAAGGTQETAAQRVAAQVAVLQEPVLALQGPAWPGQPVSLVVEREARDIATEAGEPVFCARLALDLPALGAVEIRLRVAGEAVAATVESSALQVFEAGLPDLAEQLRLRGLQPAGLRTFAAGEAQ